MDREQGALSFQQTATEFVQLLFPYQDLLSRSSSTVTPWAIAVILVYCLGSAVYLYFRLSRLGKRLGEYSTEFSAERIQQDRLLQEFWWKYEQSFLAKDGEPSKTELDAAEVFNERDLLSRHANTRYWAAVPGTLLALGIFGTFLGLTLGVTGFDTGSPEAIQSSIRTLLGGMGTAFLTSLWGMACSIAFNVFEKDLFHPLLPHQIPQGAETQATIPDDAYAIHWFEHSWGRKDVS